MSDATDPPASEHEGEQLAMEEAARRASSLIARHAHVFDTVERYCMFIGYARSGHTLIGSLLDAHRDAVIANELDALRYVDGGLGRQQLFATIVDSAHASAEAGRVQTGYSYHVPNQHQGRCETLRVIGDKKGGVSTRRLTADPGLLDKLAAVVQVPVKVLHVTRNPFDNIARIHLRSGRPLQRATHRYFKFADRNARIRERIPAGDLLDLRLEEFIADPRAGLTEVCAFLGLTCTDEYLEDAAAVVFASPKRSRDKVDWPPELVADIERRIESYPFLSGYRFDR